MKRMMAKAGGLALALSMMAGGAVGAQPADLSGVWQADNGESRYSLDLCGDGTQLCATLTWIQPDKIDSRNKPYIGKLVVDHARLVKTNPLTWQGKINVYGNVVNGSVTLVKPNRFVVKGCAFLIFCEETGATRISDTTAKTKG